MKVLCDLLETMEEASDCLINAGRIPNFKNMERLCREAIAIVRGYK